MPMPTKRRILIFSLVYYPHFIGGAEVAIKEITDRISGDDIEFDMITLRKQESAYERIGNVHVYRVGLSWIFFPLSKFLYIIFAWRKALTLYSEKKYDGVWAVMASYAGVAARLFKKSQPNVPFFLTIQEGDNFEKRQGVFASQFKKIFKAADHIQVISAFLKDWSEKMGATCPVTIIPNGVDNSLFSKPVSDARKAEITEKIAKKSGDIVLITTSRLVPKNAVIDVVDALRYLPAHVIFVILGSGPEEDILKRYGKKIGVADRVRYMGYVPHAEMSEYLSVSDIFIRPSLSEGFGNSFIEAMAAKVPVIATPVGGIVDFLRDGETGILCEVHNPKNIAQKVEKIMKDANSRESIIQNAYMMVQKEYDWNLVAQKMKRFLLGSLHS
jgi:glycosyltransferase involved in cell wall biosynthesis